VIQQRPLITTALLRLAGFLSLGLLLTPATSAVAQIPYLDPLPWSALADSVQGPALLMHYDRFDDEKYNWIGNRLGLTSLLPSGGESCLFLRAYYLALDSGQTPVLGRWPDLAGEDAAGWPGESRTAGWVRPEFGLLSWIRMPVLGRAQWGFAVALPVGRDELYPLTAASMPVRANLRKVFAWGAWSLTAGAGYVQHLDSGRSYLKSGAFPSGPASEAALTWHPHSLGVMALTWAGEDLEGHHSSRLGCQWWIPYRERHAMGLAVQREVAGAVDRPFATQVTLVWRWNSSSVPTPP
jgi:hypothetical protein